MRLYVKGESKRELGYFPDWLKVQYKENENTFELTLDIVGEVDYSSTTLDCRCKTDIIPWTLLNLETGEETNLYDLSKEEVDKLYPLEKVTGIIYNSESYRVGVYPVDDSKSGIEDAKGDVLSNGEGTIEIFNGFTVYKKSFKFEPELNIY